MAIIGVSASSFRLSQRRPNVTFFRTPKFLTLKPSNVALILPLSKNTFIHTVRETQTLRINHLLEQQRHRIHHPIRDGNGHQGFLEKRSVYLSL